MLWRALKIQQTRLLMAYVTFLFPLAKTLTPYLSPSLPLPPSLSGVAGAALDILYIFLNNQEKTLESVSPPA